MFMYEVPITNSAKNEAPDGTQLRAPDWGDLVTKLAAMRDLRTSLQRQQSQLSGAFSGFADIREESAHESDSQHIIDRDDALTLQNVNKTGRGVNLKALADCKGLASKSDGMQNVTPCDREIK